MEKKPLILGLVAMVALGMIAWAVLSSLGGAATDQAAAVSSTEPIKIAALLSLSGPAASWGENAQKAIELAADELNQSGGINGRPVEIIYEDTAGDPKKAVSAYQLVTSIHNVTAVIGPLSQTEDVAVMPVIAKTGTPTIVPGYMPLESRSALYNPLLVWMDAQVETSRLAHYIYNQGVHTMAVVGTLDSWETTVSDAFVDAFKAAGGTITAVEIVQPSSSDIRLSVTKIVGTKPQGIFLGTYYQFINATKELHDLGYAGKLYSIEVDDYLAEQTAARVEGLEFVAPDYYTTEFRTKFKEKYSVSPGLPAGQSYDAANVLFSFLKESTNQKKILEAMKTFRSYEGVSGKLTINGDGRVSLPTALFGIKQGTITRISALP